MTSPATPLLAPAAIAAMEEGVRDGLTGAIGLLTRLREGQAHLVTGHPTWTAYALDRFGDLLAQLRLPREERLHLVRDLASDGETVRGIARKLGVAPSTAQADLDRLGPGARPERAVGADGRSRPTAVPALRVVRYSPAEGMTRRAETVARVAFHGEVGLTCLELEAETGWRHGIASSPLSWAKRTGRVVSTGTTRDGYEVFRAPDA